jgi:hypothetical protein
MLINLPAVAVSNAAVVVAPASQNRRKVSLVQTTANAVRVGAAGVTAVTGYRLGQNERVELETTDAVYAIREGGGDGSVSGIEDRRR